MCFKLFKIFSVFLFVIDSTIAPARILKVPREKKVQIGSEVTLECNATGNPIPSITWLENGNTVNPLLYKILYSHFSLSSPAFLSTLHLLFMLALALWSKLIVLSSHLTGTESTELSTFMLNVRWHISNVLPVQ